MQRIVVMGPPGSGKSTLARQLGAKLGVPVYHLDQAYWQPGWVKTPVDCFQAEVERLAGLPAWVIDGNYTGTIGPRFAGADMVIYLDVPTWLSIVRVLRRLIVNYGRVRADAALGCTERVDLEFLRFIWSWNRLQRSRTITLVESFPGSKVVLRTRAERRQLLTASV